jgi:hypothetical protein
VKIFLKIIEYKKPKILQNHTLLTIKVVDFVKKIKKIKKILDYCKKI